MDWLSALDWEVALFGQDEEPEPDRQEQYHQGWLGDLEQDPEVCCPQCGAAEEIDAVCEDGLECRACGFLIDPDYVPDGPTVGNSMW